MSAEVVPPVANVAQRAALEYLAAGLSVIPIATDGTKAPLLGSWEPYQKALPKESEVRFWYGQGEFGVAVVCGEVSGHLAVFDFEFAWLFEEWAELVRQEMPGVLERLPQVLTPGKTDGRGVHLYARFPKKAKTCKLAKMSAKEAEETLGDKGATTLIELKAEGGYVLAPGSPAACHPSGRLYELMPGVRIEDVPVLTEDEAENLLSACRALHSGDDVRRQVGTVGRPMTHGERPGESFNRQAGWRDILEPHGWACVRETSGKSYWRRPGKSKGISATTGYCRTDKSGDMLYVFSSNADPFEEGKAYSKFAAYAWLNFAGNYSAAGSSLAAQGFGSRGVAPVYGEDGDAAAAPAAVAVKEWDADDDKTPGGQADCPLMDFPVFVLPKKLAEYVHEVARSVSGPTDFPGVVLLSLASAAIGASRAIAVTRTWTECPRLFTASVGDPGSAKSPSLKLMQSHVVYMQKRLHADFLAEKQQYEMDKAEYDACEKELSRKRAKAKADSPGQAVPVGPEGPPVKPVETHLFTTDATVEALIPMLADNPRGVCRIMDEVVAWVTSMNQYKGGKGADKQFWLSAWSGEAVKTDRKSSRESGSLMVPNPFVTVMGGITPDVLGMLSDEKGRADGFIDRILFCYPAEKPWPERVGAAPSEAAEQAWRECLDYLYAMGMVVNQDGTLRPFYVQMSAEAEATAAEWYAEHARERNDPDFPFYFVGPWSKLRAYYYRLTLILFCLRKACGETQADKIDNESAEGAVFLIDYFKSHMRKTYSRLQSKPEDAKAERLLRWISARGGVATSRELIQARFAKKKSEANQLLFDLRDRGFGSTEQGKRRGGGGDPNVRFELKKISDAAEVARTQHSTA